jgi:HEAT repeat protein/predicted Ser/Thr protein kinase
MDSDAPISDGTTIANRYEIEGVLGEGGMGLVYKAKDRVLEEVVALKVLRPNFARTPEADRRFRSEIKLARKVSHRNVCRIHEYGEDGSLRYLSMEYIDGVNLKQAVRGKGGLPIEDAREITIQIAKGLQAIHDVGIIHRDLKTANLMRDGRGIVRLMDFGIAKKWGEEAGEGMTGVGDIIGTPEYMSPEQARGQKLDFRSDLYALGIVMFELLTGELPFRGETPLDTLLKHVQEPPPLEGRIQPELIPILRKALAKDPRERYASARGLVADLRATQGVPTAGTAPIPAAVFAGNLAQTGPQDLLALAAEDSDILPVTPPSMPAPDTSFDALADLGPPVDDETQAEVRALAGKLKAPDVNSRWKAAMALLQFGPAAKDAVPMLLEAIDDEAPSVAEAAAQSYRKITGKEPPPPKPKAPPAPKVSQAVTGLIEQLRSEDSFVRWRAVLALGELGEQASPATDQLEELLDDKDDNVRWTAATTLGKIGPGARAAVPALAAALSDRDDPVIHRHAAAALARLGAAARDAVPGLIGALKDKDSNVREEVVEALVRIGAAAVPPLIEALKDDDERVRFEAADALTKIGTTLQKKKAS